MIGSNPYMIFHSEDGKFTSHRIEVYQKIVAPIVHSKEKLDHFIQQKNASLWPIMQKIDQWDHHFLSSRLVGVGKIFSENPGLIYQNSKKKAADILSQLKFNLPQELLTTEQAEQLIQCISDYIQSMQTAREQHGQWFAEAICSLPENPFSLKITEDEARNDFNKLKASTSPVEMQGKPIILETNPLPLKGYSPPQLTDLQLKVHSSNCLGRVAVGFYSGDLLAKASSKNSYSLDQIYKNEGSYWKNSFFYKFVGQVHYTGAGHSKTVSQAYLRRLATTHNQSPGQFYIRSGYSLLWDLLSTDTVKLHLLHQMDYFDPFAGWGDRLMIALLFAHHYPQLQVNYLGNDCNRALLEPYHQIVKTYGANLPNFKAHFSMQTIENFIKATNEYATDSKITTPALTPLWESQDVLQLHHKKGFDLSVTSPPYADMEHYMDMPDYSKMDVFKQMFVEFSQFYAKYLRQNGYFILNMAFNPTTMKRLNISMNEAERILLINSGGRGLELVKRVASSSVTNALSAARRNAANKEHEGFVVFRMIEKVQPSLFPVIDELKSNEEKEAIETQPAFEKTIKAVTFFQNPVQEMEEESEQEVLMSGIALNRANFFMSHSPTENVVSKRQRSRDEVEQGDSKYPAKRMQGQ